MTLVTNHATLDKDNFCLTEEGMSRRARERALSFFRVPLAPFDPHDVVKLVQDLKASELGFGSKWLWMLRRSLPEMVPRVSMTEPILSQS